MKAVIVTSSYPNMERTDLLKECYEKRGYETTVLMTDFIHSSKSFVKTDKEGYVFIKTKPYKKNISISRLASHDRFAKDVLKKLETMEVDLLHVMIPANSLTKIAKQYKEIHPNVKLYLDLIDLWPETMPINRFKNLYPFQVWRKLRDENLDNADGIYCECDLFRKVLKREDDKRFRILYWVKANEPEKSFPQISGEELSLCYLGSMNNVIDIDYIVQMCEEIGKRKTITVHVIGDGEKREELLEKLRKTEAQVVYHGLVYDSKKKQEVFDQCHFGLNIMKPSVCVGLTMKSLDYFQAGLPLINNIEGDTAEMIKEYKIGFHGYQDLIKKLDDLKKEDYLKMRENVKKLYHEKFTKEAFERNLIDETRGD